MAWDWFVMDIAYVMVLVGGGMVLRAKLAMPITWLLFGMLSVAVGGFLGAGTYLAPTTLAPPDDGGALKALTTTC